MWLNIPLSRASDNITVIVIQEVLKVQYFNVKILSKHPDERLLIRKRPRIQILNISRSKITCWFLSYFCLFVSFYIRQEVRERMSADVSEKGKQHEQ